MANLTAAKKSIRSDARKRVFNDRVRRKMKTAVKATRQLVEAGKSNEAASSLSDAYKAIDKAAKRGIIKDNTAARKKSRLAATVKKASAAS